MKFGGGIKTTGIPTQAKLDELGLGDVAQAASDIS